jgi:hypothetical protein
MDRHGVLIPPQDRVRHDQVRFPTSGNLRGSGGVVRGMQVDRRTQRGPSVLGRGLLGAMVALMLLLAAPGPILAKWTIAVEFEPASATVGESARLAAVVSIPSHEVPGMEVPSLRDIEPVFFRLESLETREVIEVPGVADGQREGRYFAEVALPEPGEWQVQLSSRSRDGRPPISTFRNKCLGR